MSRFIHALWLTRKKKYCLVFPKGKGFLGGWATLVEKLHSLGVMTREENCCRKDWEAANSDTVLARGSKEEGCPLFGRGPQLKGH